MKFSILGRSWKIEILQTRWSNIKYELQKTGSQMSFIPHLLLSFNEHVHKSPDQSFRGLSDVFKDDWAFSVLERRFQMWTPNTLTLSSPNVKW